MRPEAEKAKDVSASFPSHRRKPARTRAQPRPSKGGDTAKQRQEHRETKGTKNKGRSEKNGEICALFQKKCLTLVETKVASQG